MWSFGEALAFRWTSGPIDAAVRFVGPIESDVTKWSLENRGFVFMSSQVAMIESETGASLPKLCRAATWSAYTWRCSEIFGWFLPRFGPKQLGVTCFGEKLNWFTDFVHVIHVIQVIDISFCLQSCHITGRSADCMHMCAHDEAFRCI